MAFFVGVQVPSPVRRKKAFETAVFFEKSAILKAFFMFKIKIMVLKYNYKLYCKCTKNAPNREKVHQKVHHDSQYIAFISFLDTSLLFSMFCMLCKYSFFMTISVSQPPIAMTSTSGTPIEDSLLQK